MKLAPCASDPLWQNALRLLALGAIGLTAAIGVVGACASPLIIAWWMCKVGRCG
jgi:hypothetical protein